jgi:hypothetical protein
MNFYRVPTNLVSVQSLKTMRGAEGTYLNPILDENDIWIISMEERNGSEFQTLWEQYPEISEGFELIDTTPKSYSEFWGI